MVPQNHSKITLRVKFSQIDNPREKSRVKSDLLQGYVCNEPLMFQLNEEHNAPSPIWLMFILLILHKWLSAHWTQASRTALIQPLLNTMGVERVMAIFTNTNGA